MLCFHKGLSDVAMVDEYMSTLGAIYPAVDGRIQIVNGEDTPQCPSGSATVTSRLDLMLALAVAVFYLFTLI